MSTVVIGQEESKKECVEGDLNKNVDCDTSLNIKGSIPDGLKVLCRGTLTVGGSVGASEIICYGDLIVDKEIVVNGKSNIIVKGHLRADSISGAQIEAEKNITVRGDIINSNVKCRNNVSVGGAIEGGEVASASAVITRRIGKDGQSADFTKVEAGTNFRLKVMYDEMDQELAEITAKADKIRSAVLTLETKEKTLYTGLPHAEKKLLKSTKESLDVFEKQILGLKARQQKLLKKLEQTTNAFIEVGERIVPGSRIAIQHRYVVAGKEYPSGKYTIREDRICRI